MIIMKYPFHPVRWLFFVIGWINCIMLLVILVTAKFYIHANNLKDDIDGSDLVWFFGFLFLGVFLLSYFWSMANKFLLLDGGDVYCPKCGRKGFLRRTDRSFVCRGCGFKMVVEGFDKLNPKSGEAPLADEQDQAKRNVLNFYMWIHFFEMYAYLIGGFYRFGNSDGVYLREAGPEEGSAKAQNGDSNISVNPRLLRYLGRNIDAPLLVLIIAASVLIFYFGIQLGQSLSGDFSPWTNFAISVFGLEFSLFLLFFFYRWVAKSPGKYWVELTPDGQEISNEGGRI